MALLLMTVVLHPRPINIYGHRCIYLDGNSLSFFLSFFLLEIKNMIDPVTSDGFINWQFLLEGQAFVPSFISPTQDHHGVLDTSFPSNEDTMHAYWYGSMTQVPASSIHPVCIESIPYGFACICMTLPTTLILIQTKISGTIGISIFTKQISFLNII